MKKANEEMNLEMNLETNIKKQMSYYTFSVGDQSVDFCITGEGDHDALAQAALARLIEQHPQYANASMAVTIRDTGAGQVVQASEH